MNKNNKQIEKLPRYLVIANNKKQTEINNILFLRDEMISNNIDAQLIKNFTDEQYAKIIKEYEDKIKKHNEKKPNNNLKLKNENKKKKKIAIEFLLKNKLFLEECGASKEYIKNYVETQYKEINEYYDTQKLNNNINNDIDNDIDNDNVDFID